MKDYSLQEIIELNDLEEVDVLYFLVKQLIIDLPSPKPLDFDD